AVWFAEFDLEIINARINSKLKKFEEFTKFPVIRRDLAVVIPKSVSFDSLKQIASKSCGKNLVDVNVFDVFEDEKKLGEGKKSYALNFTFESLEKSLNSEEIDKIMNKLIENYESQIEAIIRR
ncbi:MAG: phenylalanine--tRNA ligase subunit beta, partial [Saprospiraceae bacterium]